MIDKLLKVTSVSSILLILLGIYNLNRYYSKYDVSIFNFMDTSEILLSFSNVLIVVLTVVLGLSLVLSVVFTAYESAAVNAHQVGQQHQVDVSKYNNRIKLTLRCVLIVQSIATFYWIYLCFRLLADIPEAANTDPFVFDGLYIFSNLLSIPYLIFLRAHFVPNGQFVLPNAPFAPAISILGVITSMIIFFEIRNHLSFKLIEQGFAKSEVEITLDNGSTTSTSNELFYVSSTRNYHFFRDRCDNKTVVIPVSEVKTFKIRNLRSGF